VYCISFIELHIHAFCGNLENHHGMHAFDCLLKPENIIH